MKHILFQEEKNTLKIKVAKKHRQWTVISRSHLKIIAMILLPISLLLSFSQGCDLGELPAVKLGLCSSHFRKKLVWEHVLIKLNCLQLVIIQTYTHTHLLSTACPLNTLCIPDICISLQFIGNEHGNPQANMTKHDLQSIEIFPLYNLEVEKNDHNSCWKLPEVAVPSGAGFDAPCWSCVRSLCVLCNELWWTYDFLNFKRSHPNLQTLVKTIGNRPI